MLEPKFSGLLSSAPSVVGDARSIVTDFDVYQRELARLVTNVTKLYDATSTLPVYRPDPATLRVLHVSDVHLNPASWQIIGSLVRQYDIDVIIDSGDTMDHGSAVENGFLDPIRDLGAPYVWVRGNHDSRITQMYLERFKNVHVLDDGRAVDVGGLRVAYMGTPSSPRTARSLPRARPPSGWRACGSPPRCATRSRPARRSTSPSPTSRTRPARRTARFRWSSCGHVHHRQNELMRFGTRLKVEGSTGGGGLRALQNKKPEKVRASVLYLDRTTRRLQAWDEITLGGLGLTTAEVSRHLPEGNQPGATPSPIRFG